MDKRHIGSDFDDFLRDEELLDDTEAVAAKRVIAFQISQEMERCHISKAELARRMHTSRPTVDRYTTPSPSPTGVLEAFTAQTGIKVRVLKSGDAGAMLNQAILAKDHPLTDVLYGVDKTFLSRVLDAASSGRTNRPGSRRCWRSSSSIRRTGLLRSTMATSA